MNNDLAIDERRASCLPEDWPEDIGAGPVTYNACHQCIKIFLGRPSRIQCRLCAKQGSPL